MHHNIAVIDQGKLKQKKEKKIYVSTEGPSETAFLWSYHRGKASYIRPSLPHVGGSLLIRGIGVMLMLLTQELRKLLNILNFSNK